MTLLDIKTLARNCLDEATAALFTDANIIAWANAAERDIASKSGCVEQVQELTTSSGVRYVAFTGNKVNTVELVIEGSEEFIVGSEVNWQDTDDNIWQDTDDNVWYDITNSLWIPYPPVGNIKVTPHHIGHIALRESTSPQYWFQWGNYVYLEPVPDDAYTLNAYVSVSPTDEMSDDADTPEIPEEFQSAIVPYVVFMGKLKERKYAEAAGKYIEYTGLLQSLIDKYIRRRASRVKDIRLPDSMRIR